MHVLSAHPCVWRRRRPEAMPSSPLFCATPKNSLSNRLCASAINTADFQKIASGDASSSKAALQSKCYSIEMQQETTLAPPCLFSLSLRKNKKKSLESIAFLTWRQILQTSRQALPFLKLQLFMFFRNCLLFFCANTPLFLLFGTVKGTVYSWKPA